MDGGNLFDSVCVRDNSVFVLICVCQCVRTCVRVQASIVSDSVVSHVKSLISADASLAFVAGRNATATVGQSSVVGAHLAQL